MATLRTALHNLASSFADSVLHGIRGASLEELLGEAGGGARRGPGRPRKPTAAPTAPGTPRGRKSGRLPRRSAEQIAKALDQVIALVKSKKEGLRAEQNRSSIVAGSRLWPPRMMSSFFRPVSQK